MKSILSGEITANLDFDASDQSPVILQAMTNLKMAAAMEYLSKPKHETRSIKLVSRLESTVSKISGKEFSFDIITHPELRIRVRWGNEYMAFGALPDGLRSIIGWLVACASRLSVDFPEHESPLDIPVVILVDEPETHLHPAWQQQLIPAAQLLFPNSQMFIVTHSPFIVSSVNSGYVHVLSESNGTIVSSKPMECSKGDTWIDAVEDALGLKTWYDPETEQMLTRFRQIKDEILQKKESPDKLQPLANEIASRSDSLSNLIGKEMFQLQRLMEGHPTPQ
jgi:predicted ATP-binding protein involved in virulence